MKRVSIFILLINVFVLSQTNGQSLKRIGEYSDTTTFYYKYSSPFSYVFRNSNTNEIKIEMWTLVYKDKVEKKYELLDKYLFNRTKPGKYLFLWDRENQHIYKGPILFLLFCNGKLRHHVRFIQN